jgi:predicted transcriptional regulator
MSETVADLVLDDEHVTIGLEDSLVEGCKRLVSIPSGILVVLDDDDQVKGVIGQRQMLKAIPKLPVRKLWKWMFSKSLSLS